MRLVFDLEGNGLKEECNRIWCLVAYDLDSKRIWKWGRPEGIWQDRHEIRSLFAKADELIGHNIIDYDLTVLGKLHYYPTAFSYKKATDTLILSQLLRHDRSKPEGLKKRTGPHALESWGLRVGIKKPEHEDWTQYSEDMLKRCTDDVKITVMTYKRLMHEKNVTFARWSWDLSIRIEHEVRKIQTQQELNGWLFDVDFAKECVRDLDERCAKLYSEILPYLEKEVVPEETKVKGEYNWVKKPFLKNGKYSASVDRWLDGIGFSDTSQELVGGPFCRVRFEDLNLGQTAKLKEQLFKLGWKPDEWNFNSEGVKTSPKITESSLSTVQGDLGDKIRHWVVYQHRKSQIEGWLKTVRPDGRIPAEANTLGAVTGRYTHRKIVNVPKASDDVIYGWEMRRCFIVPEGKKLVGCDASGLELRLFADALGREEYIKTVIFGKKEDGTDPHTKHQKAAGVDNRDDAKTFFYAFIYGAGDAKIGKIVDGTSADGKRLRTTFTNSIPGLKELLDNVKREAKQGYITGLDGRRMVLRQEHKALNTKLQGAGALVMKVALLFLNKWIKQRGLDVKFVGNIHDEFQAEVADKDVEEYAKLAPKAIEKAGKFLKIKCPLTGEAQVGLNWAETH